MIYTLTFNPSFDYYLEFDSDIVFDSVNRSGLDYYCAGGKGVNISMLLSNMGVYSRTLGFLGGFVKSEYLKYLLKYEFLEPAFCDIDGNTRINVKCINGGLLEFNSKGPKITKGDLDNLSYRINKIDRDDIVIISGNTQVELYDYLEGIIDSFSSKGVRFVLDIDIEMIRRLIKYRPVLVKFDLLEINAFFNVDIIDNSNVFEFACKLYDMGAINVIVSLGDYGSVMVNSDGLYRGGIIDSGINSLMVGDSMIAGFVFGLQRGSDYLQAYRYCCCCYLACDYTIGLSTRDKIDQLYEQFEIEFVGRL